MGIFSSASTYAIRAALYVAIADLAAGEFLSTRRIAEDLDVPFPFLTKVLKGMARGGIFVSQRGPAGGVALRRPAAEITLLEIVQSAGGDNVFHSCVLGLPTCSNETPCALHVPWTVERGRIEDLFTRTTLAALVARKGAAAPGRQPRRSGRDPVPAKPSRRKGKKR